MVNFIKSRFPNSDYDWSKAIKINTQEMIDNILKGLIKYQLDGVDNNEEHFAWNVELEYNPNAEFDYCTMSSNVHDGTMLFVKDTVDECFCKVVKCETYDSRKNAPTNNCTVHYTVGDMFVINEYGEKFATKDKPWLMSRTSVFLPIKYEYKE